MSINHVSRVEAHGTLSPPIKVFSTGGFSREADIVFSYVPTVGGGSGAGGGSGSNEQFQTNGHKEIIY